MRRYAPHSTTSRERALAAVGDDYPTGWCLRFAATDVLGVPGTTDWSNTEADCHDFWAAAVKAGTVIETDNPAKIPARSLVIWAGEPYGHAAYALGDGQAVGTDFPERGKIDQFAIADLGEQWGYELLGAILVDGNGYLYEPRPDDYRPTFKVTAKGGSRGHTRPDSSAPAAKKLRKGTTVEAAMHQVRFKVWAEVDGAFYPLDDLERVG